MGDPPPPEKSQNIGFLSNTGQDPLKYTKLRSQHSLLGHYRHASETPFKWPAYSGICLDLLPSKKKIVKVGSPLTKISGSAHENTGEGECRKNLFLCITKKFLIFSDWCPALYESL